MNQKASECRRAAFFSIGCGEPSARFRIMPYIPLLQNAGWHCTVWHQWPSYGSRLFAVGRSPRARLVQFLGMFATLPHVLTAGDFDLVFLQRRLAGLAWPPLLERLLRRTSRRIVFDYDDAIYLGSRSEVSFREITDFSDQIVAGNAHLAKVANWPSKTTLIPTPVDTDRFKPCSRQAAYRTNPLTIGWTGTAPNYQYLYPLAPTLRRIRDRFPDVVLKVICDRAPDPSLLSDLDVQFVPWQPGNEVDQLQDIDVGIMYLPDTPWTKGKCGFKLIQYMSLAKPAVASAVGANLDIVNHGVNGYLAATMEDWYECLTRLLGDAHLRTTMGCMARETIEENFSVHACLAKLVAVFERTMA
jgi:glycosyltransferase involved in cell wall biosynthesis